MPVTREEELYAVTVGTPERLDGPVILVDPDPGWPAVFEQAALSIRHALGRRALLVEHVSSTSVPGLIAKPIIDIALVVPDAAEESTYAPASEEVGYRRRIRSPAWEQHRMFKGPDNDVNLHVFALGSREVERMLLFRDHLRGDSNDCERYAAEKRALARREWAYVQYYADAKGPVVEDILVRAAERAANK